MNPFVAYDRGRIHLHMLRTQQFRTRHVLVKLCAPADRETITARSMLPYLWMQGTEQHPSPLALARYTDELFGASLRAVAGKRGSLQTAEVYASSPEERRMENVDGVFESLLDLVLEVLAHPLQQGDAFPEANVARERSLHERRLLSIRDDKMAYAMERCLQNVLRDTREGLPRLGFVEDLKDLTPERLWEAHQQFTKEAVLHIYAIGDFQDEEKVARQLLDQFDAIFPAGAGTGVDGKETLNPIESLPRLAEGTDELPQVLEDEEPVQQGKLNLGYRTGIARGSKDYPAMVVCNGILGGFPHSKLFINVREKASLAYYASSRIDGLSGVLAIQTGIQSEAKEQAEEIIRNQIRAIQAGEITDEELELTRKALQNQYRTVMDQPASRSEIHLNGVLAGVNQDVEHLLSEVEQVQIEDVVRVSQNLQLDTVYFLRDKEVAAREA